MSSKIAEYIDSFINICILIVGLVLLFVGTYSMIDNLYVYQNAVDKSLKIYRPSVDEPMTVSQKITDDQVGWIVMDDTSIDYPVMQGDDNALYLNRDPYGNFSLSGSIFLDSRNDSRFRDHYSLIYGHHMAGDIMFGALDKYVDEDYYTSHKIGHLVTSDAVYDYQLFCVIADYGTNSLLFNPKKGTYDEILSYLRENSMFYEEPPENLKLLCLSTCSGSSTDRLLIVGTLKSSSDIVSRIKYFLSSDISDDVGGFLDWCVSGLFGYIK